MLPISQRDLAAQKLSELTVAQTPKLPARQSAGSALASSSTMSRVVYLFLYDSTAGATLAILT